MVTAVAILAMVAGGFASLLLLGLCVAGMPNSRPEQMREIQLWMLGIAITGCVAITAGVLLLRYGHPWWCVVVTLCVPVLLTWLLFWATTP